MQKEQPWRQYVIGAIANIGIGAAGYCMGWTAPVNMILDDPDLTPLPEPVTPDQSAWVASLINIGAIIGPFVGGFASSLIGYKWSLLSSSIPFLIGWLLILISKNVVFLYAGRVLWGVAMGIVFALTPVYCIEIATVDARGALGSYLQTFITFGTLVVYAAGTLTTYHGIAYMGIGLVILFMITFFFMPETPTYYLIKKDRESAAKALSFIRGKTLEGVQEELDIKAANVDSSKNETGKFTDMFRGKNFKALYIVCLLMFFQQFAGISPILFYLTEIFDAAQSNLDPAYASIIVGAVQFGASITTQFIVDRLGRRLLMMISSLGSAVSLSSLALYFLLAEIESPITESIHFLPLLSLNIFMIAFCWGLGALPWAMMGELLPIEVKKYGASIATALYWTLSFLITNYFGAIGEAAGMYVVYSIFAACCLTCFFFTFFLLPETKDKTYQEIQDMLDGRTKKQQIT